jgi:hypothetical protein
VIDELRSIAIRSINDPVTVQASKNYPIGPAGSQIAPPRLLVIDSIPSVFNNDLFGRDCFPREDSEMVNARAANQ